MNPPLIVRAVRQTTAGPTLETIHRVHVVVTAPSGEVLSAAGDASYTTPARSCLKPLQAGAIFASGAVERFEITPAELALACASHEGAEAHTTQIAAWLKRMGLAVAALQCGAHQPGDPDAVLMLRREGQGPSALHNNCSGKHAGMLAASLAMGADHRHYLHARHPVQRLVKDAAARLLGAELVWGVDGCSAPTPVAPLSALATFYGRLMAAAAGVVEDPVLAQIGRAMLEHPELIGGRGVIDTRLMRSIGPQGASQAADVAGPRALLAKRGADGVYAAAYHHPERGPLGLAFKVEDGSAEARAPAVLAALEAVGALTPPARVALADLIRPERKNHRGLRVGHLEVEAPPGFTL